MIGRFTSQLAAGFGVQPADIEITSDRVRVLDMELLTGGSLDFSAFIGSAVIEEQINSYIRIRALTRRFHLIQLQRHPSCRPETGIMNWPEDDCYVFGGSFGGSTPNLDGFQPLLLGLAVWFEPNTANNLVEAIERVGPLAWSVDRPPPFDRLALAGYFPHEDWVMTVRPPEGAAASLPVTTRPNLPPEIFRIVRYALQSTDGPDVLFLRLYRALEVLIAVSIQQEIAAAPIEKVTSLIRTMSGGAELNHITRIVDPLGSGIAEFSRSDWDALFGATFKPGRDSYSRVIKWLDSGQHPVPDNARAQLVYFVRNALAHAKIQEGDPLLVPPFSPAQSLALERLSADLLMMVRELSYQ